MKKHCFTLVLLALLFAAAAHGQGATEALNRSHVGMVYVTDDGSGNAEVGVQLKFDFINSPAEQTYFIEVGSACCGLPGDPKKFEPIAGRWDPDTTESVGFFNRQSPLNRFYLRTAQTTGDATLVFDFFPTTPQNGLKLPLMGDWDGDGLDSAGVYNRNKGKIHLKNSNTKAELPVTIQYPDVAGQGSKPVAGDWDGDGMDGTAIFLPIPRIFRFFNDPYSTAFTDYTIPATPGAGTLRPVAGDWNYDGKDFVGVYGEADQTFYLLNTDASGGWDVILPFPMSEPFSKPIAGSWDGESFRYAVPKTFGGQSPSSFPQLIVAGKDHELYFGGISETLVADGDSLYYNLSSNSNTETLYTNDQWAIAPSTEILGHSEAAIALGTVFSAPGAEFKHPDGTFYEKLVVYVVEHRVPSDTAGWVCLSYSDANNNWTTPIFATTAPGATPSPCVDDGFVSNDVLAEAVSGFREGSDLYFGVMNGDLGELAMGIGTEVTNTHLYKATATKPWYFALQDVGEDDGEFTSDGMNTPNTGGRWVHNYGINLDFTLDPVQHAVYWARTYPYPFDIAGGIPCDNQQMCAEGFGQNPNRIQIYRMQLTPGQSFGQQLNTFFAGPWELVTDTGASKGWPSTVGGVCGDTELIDPIQDGLPGTDINSVTFVKDGDGLIARDSEGRRVVLFGGAAVKDRVNGECDFGERSIFAWPFDRLLNNSPPVAVQDGFSTLWETPINIPHATLLANDTDPDGDPLSVCGVEVPQYGTITEFANSVTYTPPAGCLVGLDSFDYKVCDGLDGEDTGRVQIQIGGIICPSGSK